MIDLGSGELADGFSGAIAGPARARAVGNKMWSGIDVP